MKTWWIYHHLDCNGELLYVGSTSKPGQRQRAHAKTAKWRLQIAETRYTASYRSEKEALAAELQDIQELDPIYNQRRDGRSYWQWRQLRQQDERQNRHKACKDRTQRINEWLKDKRRATDRTKVLKASVVMAPRHKHRELTDAQTARHELLQALTLYPR